MADQPAKTFELKIEKRDPKTKVWYKDFSVTQDDGKHLVITFRYPVIEPKVKKSK